MMAEQLVVRAALRDDAILDDDDGVHLVQVADAIGHQYPRLRVRYMVASGHRSLVPTSEGQIYGSVRYVFYVCILFRFQHNTG